MAPSDLTAGVVVSVVDDEPLVRETISHLIESVGLCVRTYPSAEAFLEEYDPTAPGCVIADVCLQGMSGPELQERLRTERTAPPVILLTGYGDIPTAVKAMRNGAAAFLEKPYAPQDLLDRVSHAIRRDTQNRRRCARDDELEQRLSSLTAREYQILDRLVAGQCNRSIAGELGVSNKTVESHRRNIMMKTRAESIPALVRLVLSQMRSPDGIPVPVGVGARQSATA